MNVAVAAVVAPQSAVCPLIRQIMAAPSGVRRADHPDPHRVEVDVEAASPGLGFQPVQGVIEGKVELEERFTLPGRAFPPVRSLRISASERGALRPASMARMSEVLKSFRLSRR